MNTRILLLILGLVLGLHFPTHAESEITQELADRYELILVRSPRSGAALDRVIEWYSTQGGGVEVLQKRWSDSAEAKPETRAAYRMMQGLLAERLRSPAKAREFYEQAAAMGDPAAASRLLAALETAEGNFPAAAKAYERALSGKSLAPLDRMELMRSLALLHQRAFQDEKAMAVWREAMKEFPDDASVLEEAGEAFLAAAAFDEAREAFTQLRDKSERDPFRKIAASLRLARVAEREGKTEEAVAIYNQALAETSEGSWLNREVRVRIEDLFRRQDDLPGLLAYYESRTKAVPLDATSFAAMAGVYQDLNRGPEAATTLRKAAELAPDKLELRLALIRLLNDQGKSDEALAEARELAKPAEASPEVVLLLGNLQWKQFKSTQKEEDRQLAIATWKRLAPEGSTNSAAIAQLAELFATNGEIEEAVVQWKRLIEISPSAADARQRLVEYEEKRGNSADARAILAGMIAGDRATPENYLILVRMQDRMKWKEEAAATLKEGMEKFPKDYDLLSFAWRQAITAKDESKLAEWFPKVWENAPNDFFADEAVKQYAIVLESAETSPKWLETFSHQSKEKTIRSADRLVWLRLALTQREEAAAKQALAAIEEQESPIRVARAKAEFAQVFASTDEQIAALRALAEADPRQAVESLRGVARIQVEARQMEAALQTISQLIERAPTDVALYSFYADTAAKSGKVEDAVRRLREGLRYVEDPNTLRLQLADLLQSLARLDEANAVLAEAFHQEERETRRMEIFRRQIELASQTGRLETLIATLRDKQTKESGGGRYGVYLAEIFMMQNDFLAAREELARSLGKNPDNPAAVSKLLDLSDRGGDQVESLRLAERLAELEPSAENRANALARLIESGNLELALPKLEAIRTELIENPTGWNSVLVAMRQAGQDEWTDAIIEATVTSEPNTEKRYQLAEFRISQGKYAAAEALLWQIVESENLAKSLEAVMSASPTSMNLLPHAQFQSKFHALQQIASQVQMSLHNQVQSRRVFQSRSSGLNRMGMPSLSSSVSPEAFGQIRALFLLAQLANAGQTRSAFLEKVAKQLAEASVPRGQRFVFLSSLNGPELASQLLIEQAEDPQADLASDQLMLNTPFNSQSGNPKVAEAVQKMEARVELADPQLAFRRLLANTARGLSRNPRQPKRDPAQTEELRKQIETLLNHPGRSHDPMVYYQLIGYAAGAGDFDTAFRLMEESEAAPAGQPTGMGVPPGTVQNYLQAMRGNLIAQAIQARDPRAEAQFKKWLESLDASTGASVLMSIGFRSSSSSPFLQESNDLVIGDAAFPMAAFRATYFRQPASPEGEKMRAWFAERAKGKELNGFELGLIYSEWLAGKRDAALKRVEALHATQPSPRTAALLLEMYQALKEPGKALTVLELAELQPTETADVRELRRIRLLRAAGKTTEAKEAAEKLAKGRVSSGVRDQLSNELNVLGVPLKNYPHLTAHTNRRSTRSTNPSDQIRNQVTKLIEEKKVDDAERIARQVLERPLPAMENHSQLSLRESLLQMMRSAGRLEAMEATLQARLAKNPADLDAAIRLTEMAAAGNRQIALGQVVEILKTHPKSTSGIGYLLSLLQRRSDTQAKALEIFNVLLKENPESLPNLGVNFHQLLNLSANANDGAALAETVAGMSEEGYRQLFFRGRLTGHMEEAQMLPQLAEQAVQAGKTDQAIALLKRTVMSDGNHSYPQVPATLRLAELQMKQGRKEDAAATMRVLIEGKPQVRQSFGIGGDWLNQVLSSLLMNPGSAPKGINPVQQIADLAQQTETLDLLLAKLAETQTFTPGVSPSLLIRTYLKHPGIAKEWRALAESETVASGLLSPSMVLTVIKALLDQPNSKQTLASFVQKIPDSPYNHGGDQAMGYLAEALPLLEKYRNDPIFKTHFQSVLNKAINDPNAANQYVHSESYRRCLWELMEAGWEEEAGRLFEVTAPLRNSRRYGFQPHFAIIETRLKVAKGEKVRTLVVGAAQSLEGNRMRVHWNTTLALEKSDLPDGSTRGPRWMEMRAPIPEKQRPRQLEIFAGSNPATLERVAQVAKPGVSGSVEVEVPAAFGLLLVRAQLPDGSFHWGPLVTYVNGKNEMPPSGVPLTADQKPLEGFTLGKSGPLGKKSAIDVSVYSATAQMNVPMTTFKPREFTGLLVFVGWVKPTMTASIPAFQVESIGAEGNRSTNTISLSAASPGEWQQFVKMWAKSGGAEYEANSLSPQLQEMRFLARLQASRGYNSQYLIEAAWDGLQLVHLPDVVLSDKSPELLSQARNAFDKKEWSLAFDRLVEALKESPRRTIQQSGRMWFDVAKESGRLNDLFTQLTHAALYLPNPLHSHQPIMDHGELIGLLISEALAPNAPPAAQKWLSLIQAMPLNERFRLMLEVAHFNEKVQKHPAQIQPEEVLTVLGWGPEGVQANRVAVLWADENSRKSAANILTWVDQQKLNASLLILLDKRLVPPEYQSGQRMLEAWLVAPTDPAKALERWQQSQTLRTRGPNNVQFNSEADRALLLRIAAGVPQTQMQLNRASSGAAPTELKAGDWAAAVREWVVRQNSDVRYQNQRLAEIFYEVSKLESPGKAEYAQMWQEAELTGLQTPGYNVSQDRLRMLVDRLKTMENWPKLEQVLNLVHAHPSLKNSALAAELKQLNSEVALGQGKLELAWPVVWCQPGTQSREVTVHWQWNLKSIQPEKGQFDGAIAVADQPIIPTIKNQQAVEIWFGEMPGTLERLKIVDGESSTGKATITLPKGNGFLRAVAKVGNQQIAGPLTPVISGRRVFPAEGTDLSALLTSGREPLPAVTLTQVGAAPDGSPAVQLGQPTETSRWKFAGPAFTVQPGKFYVSRSWVRRARSGHFFSSSEYQSKKIERSLQMVLSEGADVAGQWVLYTRSIPTLPEHLFWIPFLEVETVTPRLNGVESGSRIAGWELLEVEGWKYGEWITELALLRDTVGEASSEADLQRALELSAIEPLTALDYHGTWLNGRLIAAGRSTDLLSLYREALAAEPNPLFARPKLGRIFSGLAGLIDSPNTPEPIKWDAVQLALANRDRLREVEQLTFEHRYLELATARGGSDAEKARTEIRSRWLKLLGDPQKTTDFLVEALNPRNYRQDRPISDWMQISMMMEDEALLRRMLAELKSNKHSRIDASKRMFAVQGLEICLEGIPDLAAWKKTMEGAFAATEKVDLPGEFMFWPAVLGDLLASRETNAESLVWLRQRAFDRALKANPSRPDQLKELIRSGDYLIETRVNQNEPAAAVAVAETLMGKLQGPPQSLGDDTLRMMLRSMDRLVKMGEKARADAWFKLIRPQVEKSPRMKELFAQYLTVAAPTPTP